jgi:hypothetical protein
MRKKEFTKLCTVGRSNTRLVSIPAALLRELFPNVTRDSPLEGKLTIENGKIVIEIRVGQVS